MTVASSIVLDNKKMLENSNPRFILRLLQARLVQIRKRLPTYGNGNVSDRLISEHFLNGIIRMFGPKCSDEANGINLLPRCTR